MGSYTFSKKINNSLLPITFIYLLIPTILFTTFWTKPTVAIFADLILLFGAFLALWNHTSVCKEKQVSLSPATLFSSFISSLIFTYVSGAGEFINQFYDYLLHNAKFNLLTVDDWPIYNPNRKVYMCYYLGYYLVPSGLGKWFGLDSVKYISFAWLWFGLFLSLLWIHQIFRSFSLLKRTVATFMIWSGAYVAVMIPVLEKLFDKPSFLGSNSVFIGRGEMMLHYSSILKSVVEGPQHAITAILGGALFMALGCTSASVGIFSLFTIGSLFWSPFVSIGLAPFTLYTYYLYVTERGFIAFMRKQLPMLVMMLIGFLPLVLYTLGSSATQMDSNRFFTHTTASYPILLYGLFIVVSAGIWILFFRKRLFELDAAMVCISYGTLSVLALFQIGYFNDLNNRASVPALFIIGISIIHLILKSSFSRPVNYLLLAGLAFWLLNTASIFTYLYQTFITVNKAPENTISNPYNRHTNNDYYDYMEILYPMNSQEVIKQYSLNPESIFQKYLLRKSENDN